MTRVSWPSVQRIASVISASVVFLLPASALGHRAVGAHGALDPSFGSGGKAITLVGPRDAHLSGNELVSERGGKIVVLTTSLVGAREGFVLLRYNANGSVDRSFGRAGRTSTFFGRYGGESFALALQPDGKLVAAGRAYTRTHNKFVLVRFLPDGRLDRSFGHGGAVVTGVGRNSGAFALALQPDGRIVAAGYTTTRAAELQWQTRPYRDRVALVRYNPNGSLDRRFGRAGMVTTSIGVHGGAHALVLQPDGKIVAAGGVRNSDSSRGAFALLRYNPNGSLDKSFGSGGKVLTREGILGTALTLVRSPGGLLTAAGVLEHARLTNAIKVVRYEPNGSLDKTFGRAGQVETRIGPRSDVEDAALQADGKLVVSGNYDRDRKPLPPNGLLFLARYTTAGSLDRSFGRVGELRTALPLVGAVDSAVTLDPDGRIVAAIRDARRLTLLRVNP